MATYTITIPLTTDLSLEDLLEYALEFGDDIRRRTGAKVEQDEDETTVERKKGLGS